VTLRNQSIFTIVNCPPGPGSVALPDPSQVIPITAGTTYLLAANVFDWKAGLLSEYQLSPLDNAIAWNSYDLYEDEITMRLTP